MPWASEAMHKTSDSNSAVPSKRWPCKSSSKVQKHTDFPPELTSEVSESKRTLVISPSCARPKLIWGTGEHPELSGNSACQAYKPPKALPAITTRSSKWRAVMGDGMWEPTKYSPTFAPLCISITLTLPELVPKHRFSPATAILVMQSASKHSTFSSPAPLCQALSTRSASRGGPTLEIFNSQRRPSESNGTLLLGAKTAARQQRCPRKDLLRKPQAAAGLQNPKGY